jgi:hypothetical protein
METAIFENSTLIIKIQPFIYDDGKNQDYQEKNLKVTNLLRTAILFFQKF